MITYILVFCAVFVLLENFTVHIDGWVRWLPTPPHPRVFMGYAHDVQEVQGHVKSWKCSGWAPLTIEIATMIFSDRISSQLNDIPSSVQVVYQGHI
jgi:hypothetical protein